MFPTTHKQRKTIIEAPHSNGQWEIYWWRRGVVNQFYCGEKWYETNVRTPLRDRSRNPIALFNKRLQASWHLDMN